MSVLFKLPHEIILLIIQRLEQRDCFSLLSTSKTFNALIYNDLFWRDLIQRKYAFCFRDPEYQSWWQLYASGDAGRTCSHIKPFQDLSIKRALMWSSIHRSACYCCEEMIFDNYAICMEPGCTFMGCGDMLYGDETLPGHMTLHTRVTGHNVILNLSSLNFMELWCYSCSNSHMFFVSNIVCSQIGFCNSISQTKSTKKPRAEQYAARHILQFMTALPPHPEERKSVIQRRRSVEQRLSSFQRVNDYGYIIDRDWFNTWTQFLSYQSDQLPGALDNSGLFNKDNLLLHSHLVIGHDFELVSGFVRAYIERIYGLQNNSCIVSKVEVEM
ncbi:hypothetical protein K501DRAFT_331057 [Backusella circina FSU 941]|nr:hypothetical protein K501DRAFT_331057 [Backusella circina FSU 941]